MLCSSPPAAPTLWGQIALIFGLRDSSLQLPPAPSPAKPGFCSWIFWF
ncbi:hypothetical protein SLEP1_g25619 [Rubroshorea leprosula]|uniref:Uncharacterized protein n=1 Tax=Rubroshorea leprosula TaxID=152421 RepID=A0AAV5JV80_9ROSI|nr:hypothetical protein SLEP1_g25619 [Rubroshorea leprosula]